MKKQIKYTDFINNKENRLVFLENLSKKQETTEASSRERLENLKHKINITGLPDGPVLNQLRAVLKDNPEVSDVTVEEIPLKISGSSREFKATRITAYRKDGTTEEVTLGGTSNRMISETIRRLNKILDENKPDFEEENEERLEDKSSTNLQHEINITGLPDGPVLNQLRVLLKDNPEVSDVTVEKIPLKISGSSREFKATRITAYRKDGTTEEVTLGGTSNRMISETIRRLNKILDENKPDFEEENEERLEDKSSTNLQHEINITGLPDGPVLNQLRVLLKDNPEVSDVTVEKIPLKISGSSREFKATRITAYRKDGTTEEVTLGGTSNRMISETIRRLNKILDENN